MKLKGTLAWRVELCAKAAAAASAVTMEMRNGTNAAGADDVGARDRIGAPGR
jgi:hypothetical protein